MVQLRLGPSGPPVDVPEGEIFAGQLIGLPIGWTPNPDVARPISGRQAGALLRWPSVAIGTVGTQTNFLVAEDAGYIQLSPASMLELLGGTMAAEQRVLFRLGSNVTYGNVTIRHNSPGAAPGALRFFCPGNLDQFFGPGDAFELQEALGGIVVIPSFKGPPPIQVIAGGGVQNDVALLPYTETVFLDPAVTVTGFTGGYNTRALNVISGNNTSTLSHLTGSAAGNQIACVGSTNYTALRAGAVLIYQGGAFNVWRMVSRA